MKKLAKLFKNKKFLKLFASTIIVLLLICAYILLAFFNGKLFIDDSLIQAPIITISPSENGKVQEMDVTEGQNVQKGEQLAVVGSETLHSDTDALIVSAPDETVSTV